MKVCVTFLLVAIVLWMCGDPAAVGQEPTTGDGWGTPVDPDGDWPIRAGDGKIPIGVPPGMHDLWYGRQEAARRFNAPRVLREVEGDFVAQVRVTADWGLGGQPTFNGAGLLVWDSERQYIRLERNRCFNSRGQTFSYVTPLYDRDGRRVAV